MKIPYEWYKVFYESAVAMSYTKAANNLFISQSAVSQTIKQLEEQLQTQLFYKSGRQIRLTREGETLLSYIAPAVKLIAKGEDALRSQNTLKGGSIKLGASDTLSRFLLVPFLKHFHESYPEVMLTINNRPSPISSELVQKGEIDFAIVNYEASIETQRLEVIPLIEAPNVFVATPEFLAKHQLTSEKISLKKLSKCPLITLEAKSTTRRLLNSFLAEKHIKWQAEFEGGSVDLLLEMASIGVGVAFVPEMALDRFYGGTLVKVPLSDRIPTTPVGIVKHPDMPLSKPAQIFMEAMLTYFGLSQKNNQ